MTTEAERATSSGEPACIGWSAPDGSPGDDTPDSGDDYMHGCTKPDKHIGRHRCRCGAVFTLRKRRYRRRAKK